MSLGSRIVVLVSTIAVAVSLGAPSYAAEPAPTTLTITISPTYAGADARLRVDLVDNDGAPLAGAQVLLERREGGTWSEVATLTTDEAGHADAAATTSRTDADNAFRAGYAGDETHAAATASSTVPLRKRTGKVTLSGPRSVVDERQVSLHVRWRTGNGEAVSGRVKVLRAIGGGSWKKFDTVRTGADGRATLRVGPRSDSRWRAVARGLDWVTGDRSGAHKIDNLPPGKRIRLPRAAPRPRRSLPPQAHAVGDGSHLTVTRIGDRMWRQMVGVSWHRGCPVGRAGLRLVRVNYWDYSGYRRRGELVANADAATAIGGALAAMYQRKLAIRAMYRVDRFGWGRRSHGGDDYESMAAGNTSAFNCRDVTGRPGVLSPHSYGRSLDLNTWENPYRSARGTVPNTWWQGHSHPNVAWRSRSHRVVELMARHGLRWTYGLGDTQHFDYVGSRSRAAVAPERCHRYCD